MMSRIVTGQILLAGGQIKFKGRILLREVFFGIAKYLLFRVRTQLSEYV